MIVEAIERDIQEKVGAAIRLRSEGRNRFRVLTPFMFEDGDHFTIVLEHSSSGWQISDEGHTFMRLSYDLDQRALRSPNRRSLIKQALVQFGVEENDFGELIVKLSEEEFGNAMFRFVQALARISDVRYLSREVVKTAFFDDFRATLSKAVASERAIFDWTDHSRDPNGYYKVDCMINGNEKPLLIFALNGDGRTRDATIALLKFQQWGLAFKSIGVFEDQTKIASHVLAKFADICEKQFPALAGNQDHIWQYIRHRLSQTN